MGVGRWEGGRGGVGLIWSRSAKGGGGMSFERSCPLGVSELIAVLD